MLLVLYYVVEIPYLFYTMFTLDQRVNDTTIASIMFELTSLFILINVISSGRILKKSVEKASGET